MGKTVPLVERFWSKVDKKAGPVHRTLGRCWIWTGTRPRGKYGTIKIRRGESRGAHVVSFEINVGPIPDGHGVLHHCDNPPCVRPTHLFTGTAKDNNEDMLAKGRGVVGQQRPGTGPAGERNRNARLTADVVAKIRRVAAEEGLGSRQLAARFGISKSQAHNITTGAQWKEVG